MTYHLLSITPNQIIKIYKKYGFIVTLTHFGDAEKKEVHPLVAVAYDLVRKRAFDFTKDLELRVVYENITLSDVIRGISTNDIEETEFYFDNPLACEYWDGFCTGLVDSDVDEFVYAETHLDTSRLKALLDKDIRRFLDIYVQAVREAKEVKKVLIQEGLIKDEIN